MSAAAGIGPRTGSKFSPPGGVVAYAVAVLLVGAAALVHLLTGQVLQHSPFITFYLAIVLSVYLGAWPAIFAAALSTVVACFFVPRNWSYSSEVASTAFFILNAAVICAVFHSLRQKPPAGRHEPGMGGVEELLW